MPELKTLSFTGLKPHKLPFGFNEDTPACFSLKIAIKKRLIELINGENVRHFISDMAMGIDMICAELVLELQENYPDIMLEAAVTHKGQDLLWPQVYRERYRNILKRCAHVYIAGKEYSNGLIEKRNKYMVDKSDFILAIWNEKSGKVGDFMKYAQKCKKPIIIFDPIAQKTPLTY